MLESAQPAHEQPSWGSSSSETLETNRVDEQQHIEREKSHKSQEIDPDVEIVDWDGPNDPENPYVLPYDCNATRTDRTTKASTGQYGKNGS
jgi:hypothetical protein